MTKVKPLRVYVETSVWSHALANDTPAAMAQTWEFLESCRREEIAPHVSLVVFQEIEQARAIIRDTLLALVDELHPVVLPVNAEVERLAAAFMHAKIVPKSKGEDAMHVAVAMAHAIPVVASWNFKHLSNIRREDRFNEVALQSGMTNRVRIVSPTGVLHGDEESEN